jgi:hypothetical protein
MSKKTLWLIVAVLLLGGLSLYLNRDRFQSDSIQIGHRTLPNRGRRGRNTPATSLVFLIDRELKLTSVKVISLGDLATNRFPHPLWELTTDSNSVPIKNFSYGVNIRGMRPAVQGATADPLQPGVKYRLLVETGGVKLEHDFTQAPPAP